MTAHKIHLEESSPGRWRAVCSCGKYRSSTSNYKGNAESAGEQHIRSKRTRAA